MISKDGKTIVVLGAIGCQGREVVQHLAGRAICRLAQSCSPKVLVYVQCGTHGEQ